MHRGRFIFTAALAMLTVKAWAADPVVLVDLDFSRDADLAKVTINDPVAIPVEVVNENGKKRLRMTTTVSQVSSVWINTPVAVTGDYLATFQFEVTNDGGSPADGFAFVAQTTGADQIGGAGGNLGFAGGLTADSYGVEINSYSGQGGETVAWDMKGSRAKFDQSPFVHVDQGIFTAEVRVSGSKMTVHMSGGNSNMARTQVMTTALLQSLGCGEGGNFFGDITKGKPIYFGFTAATGGLGQITDILNLRVVSPAPPATAGQ
jgi:hypothetical protein